MAALCSLVYNLAKCRPSNMHMYYEAALTVLHLVPCYKITCTGVVRAWVIGGTIVLIKSSLYYLMWLSGANKALGFAS